MRGTAESAEQSAAVSSVVEAVLAVHAEDDDDQTRSSYGGPEAPATHFMASGAVRAAEVTLPALCAVAGSGKTTVLTNIVRGLRRRRAAARILLLAFNQENASVLRDRLADAVTDAAAAGGCVDVHTVHAFGLHPGFRTEGV